MVNFLYITCHGGRFAVPLTAAASRYVLRTFFTRTRTTSSGLPITPHSMQLKGRSFQPNRQLGDSMPINQLLLKLTQSFNACCGCPNCKGATHF